MAHHPSSHTGTAPDIGIRVNDWVALPLDRIAAPVALTLVTSLPFSSTARPAQWIASAGEGASRKHRLPTSPASTGLGAWRFSSAAARCSTDTPLGWASLDVVSY